MGTNEVQFTKDWNDAKGFPKVVITDNGWMMATGFIIRANYVALYLDGEHTANIKLDSVHTVV